MRCPNNDLQLPYKCGFVRVRAPRRGALLGDGQCGLVLAREAGHDGAVPAPLRSTGRLTPQSATAHWNVEWLQSDAEIGKRSARYRWR